MPTAVVLFTRDLRVEDNPALVAACRNASLVVPVFVFDPRLTGTRYGSPRRLARLHAAVGQLRQAIEARGGRLLVRRGATVEELHRIVVETQADAVHLMDDVSGFARARQANIEAMAARQGGVRVHTHPGVAVVAAGAIRPSGGDHYRVFTPYWRRWRLEPRSEPLAAPAHVPTPPGPVDGDLPPLEDMMGTVPVEVPSAEAGSGAARRQLDAWVSGPLAEYETLRDDPGASTSRLGAALHLGTLSAAMVVDKLDEDRAAHAAFLRQLCWRDFNGQLLAFNPTMVHTELRHARTWVDDPEAFTAWRDGMTGYPLIDAGMRQLAREGWMHGRVRMVVASFLTKHLGIDWRLGAWHFMDHLVDGDVANNFAQWQWAAGTGTDTRPGRMFDPVAQSRRHDPTGRWLRAQLPELAELDESVVHTPWRAPRGGAHDAYPGRIVDHAEARARFDALRAR